MPQDNSDEWGNWLSKAQKGDKVSYNKLLSEIFPYIRNFLYKKISDKTSVEDVAQEILISLHNSMNTYDGDRPFKPWLHSIISYRTMDYFRKHYRKKTDLVEDLDYTAFANDVVTEPIAAGEYKDIEAAMGTLPDKQRKVFELMRIQGYTAEEVSKKMDMSVSAVKVSVHRTAEKLKAYLG